MSPHARRDDDVIMRTTARTLSAHTNRLSTTDDDVSVPKKDSMANAVGLPARTVDKQSPEYLLKSGFAGGLAGCVVSLPSQIYPRNFMLR